MARKPQTTKTLNPLPFGALEPKRFEDLVRQLAYDFREWRSLEPTGRLGADDGYDARGFEMTVATQQLPSDDDEEEEADIVSQDRLWQIQCKREKSVTPAKIIKYGEEMVPAGGDAPYGVIFAAPCDFSKKSRDDFRELMRTKGVSEVHIWGYADLEDKLFQPKNDNLLYAYFGISLLIRKRNRTAQLRSLLATKRKTVKSLGPIETRSYEPILVRDAADDAYPYSKNLPGFKKRPHWKKYHFVGHSHNGIKVMFRRFAAFAEYEHSESGPSLSKWDFYEKVDLAAVHDDYWNRPNDTHDLEWRARRYMKLKMDKQHQAYLEIEAVIPYDRLVEVDGLGDVLSRGPHVFVDVVDDSFFTSQYWTLVSESGYGPRHSLAQADDRLRVKIFPKDLPSTEELDELEAENSKKL